MALKLNNREARKLWLDAQGLGAAPTGPLDLLAVIKSLGFVQIDSIQNVTRAHHHILWSRNQNYRESMLDKLLGKERTVFEHFTHDASVLPTEFYPMWRRQFQRLGDKFEGYYQKSMSNEAERAQILARIAASGPLSTQAFDSKIKGNKKMWARPPHKQALDYMWYRGTLATDRRENFNKFYDLSERVFAEEIRAIDHSDQDQINWLCEEALKRLAFAGLGEIQRFWQATDASEVKNWAKLKGDALQPVEITTATGECFEAYASHDITARLEAAPTPTSRLRILNPFDPAIRDRARLAKLFGFDYKIEIFVPAAKRRWGYYVYPLLEGDRFVGRIELKANRQEGTLTIVNFWPEPEVKWNQKRMDKLEAELARLGRLIGATLVDISPCHRKLLDS